MMIGQTISHYKILEKLGQGGMGVVYKAEDTKLKRTVALKFLPRDLMIDGQAKKRFYHEARAAASIVHPHVCTIYEVEEVYSKTFIVMEYLKGQNLKDMITAGPVALDRALKYAIQTAKGLKKAHEQGIVHRDIKSANIIITEEDSAKILDFGLAKFKRQTRTTKEGTIKGTIDYMSPEQTLGDKLDHRTDIWSLGVVLYEMMVGQLPFRGYYEQAVMFSIMNEDPEPLTALRTGIPMELERVVNKALAKDPGERYQHLDDLIVDLEKIQKQPKPRVSVSRKTGLFRTIDRMIKPVRVPAIILVIASLAIGGYLFFREFQKKNPSGQPVPITKTFKNKIVILPFTNLTGDKKYDNWKTALQECMITDLYQSKYLNVLSSPVLVGLLSELKLLDSEHFTDRDLKEIASRSQATDILQGNLTKSGDSIRINLAIQETGSLEIRETIKVEGTGDDSFHAMIDALTPRIKAVFNLTDQEIAGDIDQKAAQISSTPEALALYHQGLKLAEERKFTESNRVFEKALEIDPGFALACFRITINYEYLDLNDRAREYLNKALSLSERVSTRERYLIQAKAHYTFDDSYEKQITTLKTLLEFYPDDETGIGMLGGIYRNMEEWDLMQEQFEKSLDFDPASAYENFAYIYMCRGQYDRAQKVLQDNLKLFRNQAFSHFFLSNVFLCQRKFEPARREGEKALKMEPENPEYLEHLGLIQLLNGRFMDAKKIFDQLVNRNDALAQYYGHESFYFLYLTLGQFKKSKREVESTIELLNRMGQKRIEFQYKLFLAYLSMQTKNFLQAISETNQALELAAQNGMKFDKLCGLHFRGIVNLHLNQLDQAEAAAEQVNKLVEEIGKKKNNRIFLDLKGRILQKKGLIPQAIDCFDKAVSLLPAQGFILYDQAFYIHSLAAAQYKNGDLENALKNYQKINALTLGRRKWGDIYARSFYRLGKIFQQNNEKEKAITNYKKFLGLWKEADPGIEEVEDARKQLSVLEKEDHKQ